jgi:hypothetical protein
VRRTALGKTAKMKGVERRGAHLASCGKRAVFKCAALTLPGGSVVDALHGCRRELVGGFVVGFVVRPGLAIVLLFAPLGLEGISAIDVNLLSFRIEYERRTSSLQ